MCDNNTYLPADTFSVRQTPNLPAADGPDPETTRSDMCSYTHSEREINKFHIGKILFHFFFEFFQFIWIHHRVGNTDFQKSLFSQM